MSVKIFRIKGIITKPDYTMSFSKEVRAMNRNDARETLYTNFGSQHRVKRRNLKFTSIKEISIEEVTDDTILELSEG